MLDKKNLHVNMIRANFFCRMKIATKKKKEIRRYIVIRLKFILELNQKMD